MKCIECDLDLIINDEQVGCLVRHQEDIFECDGIIHDHTVPCDYEGGTACHCKNGHMVAVPTINTCDCGIIVNGSDGGFGKLKRHPTERIEWYETADYRMRRP